MRTSSRLKLMTVFSLFLIFAVGLTLRGLGSVTTHAANAAKTAGSVPCGTWSVVPSPNPSINNNLYNVSALSTSDVWAVGSSTNGALFEHWDGMAWNVVPSSITFHLHLYSIAAVSPDDVWAVGVNDTTNLQTLIEHWDGASWSVIPSPNPGSAGNYLYSVAALSPKNVWAVGNFLNIGESFNRSLIEHWNGIKWSVITSPNPGTQYNYLEAVAPISTNNVWAVGVYVSPGIQQGLIEHWNGTKWNVISSPTIQALGNNLQAVTQVPGTKQPWAVGVYTVNNTDVRQTLSEHWNGVRWSTVPSSNVGSGDNLFNGMTSIGSNNVWAVGYDLNSNANYTSQTLIEHWDGTSWNIVSSPNIGIENNVLQGVARVPGTGQVWAVGYAVNSTGNEQTLIEFCS